MYSERINLTDETHTPLQRATRKQRLRAKTMTSGGLLPEIQMDRRKLMTTISHKRSYNLHAFRLILSYFMVFWFYLRSNFLQNLQYIPSELQEQFFIEQGEGSLYPCIILYSSLFFWANHRSDSFPDNRERSVRSRFFLLMEKSCT